MNKSGDVFRLVKSLNKQEKRYFRLFASSHTRTRENNHTRLFDAIDRCDSDDDQEILKALGDMSFAPKLASAKNKLGTLLLRSLVAFNAGKSVYLDLQEMLAEIDILYRKGLYSHCGRLIARAEKKAGQLELFPKLIELQEWKRRLLMKELPDNLDAQLDNLNEETGSIIDRFHNTRTLVELRDKIFSLGFRRPHLRNASDRSVLEGISEHDYLKDVGHAKTLSGRIAYWHALGVHRLTLGQFDPARSAYKEAIRLWEANPEFVKEHPVEYKKELCDYLTSCIALKEFDDFRLILDKIKSVPPDSTDAEIHMFESVYYLEIVFCLNCGLLQEGLHAAEAISRGIARYERKIRPHRLITLYFNCGIVYFLADRFAESLRCINEIRNQDHAEAKRDGQEFITIFRLVLLYELGHIDVLENALRSTYRFLSRHETMLPFEKVMLNTIKRLLNSPDKDSSRKICLESRQSLVEVLHKAKSKEPVGLVEMLFWMESKVNGRTISETYSHKIRQGPAVAKEELFPLNSAG